MTAQGLSSRKAIQLIATREIRVRLASKAFMWTTIAFVGAVVAGGVLLNLIGSSQGAKHIGYTPAAAGITASLDASAAASGLSVDMTAVTTESAGEAMLRSG
ncbi:MAG: ABC transporter permease, partial [bacterium]|nr:ABC transporter permease [bacterium]